MGLNDVYVVGKSDILMLSPLSSINHTYSLLMQDEKLREVFVNSHFSRSSASFLATNPITHDKKFNYYQSKAKKNNLFCSNYKKPRHSVDRCFRLIDFLADFKFTKIKKFQENVKISAAFIDNTQKQNFDDFESDNIEKHFTPDECS